MWYCIRQRPTAMNDRPEDERPKNAVKEHAVLIDRRDGEVVEDQNEDEDVVDRE